jgi:hypothetical protein
MLFSCASRIAIVLRSARRLIVTDVTDDKNDASLNPGKLTKVKTHSTKSLSTGIALSNAISIPNDNGRKD